MNTPKLAYSYIRFSKATQADGDSLRRQEDNAAAWCQRNKVTLDTSTTLRDLGKSAFLGEHRKNPDRHALAAFLKLVEEGKVPRGSALIVESLDRLTREHIRPALTLLLNLIDKGVKVVQLLPVESVYDEDVEPMQLMMAIMELSRGHSESAVKSNRIGEAWAKKKELARKKEHIVTKLLPAWVEERGGKLHLIPEGAAAVRRIYELARNGYGHAAITKKLAEEKVPAIGRTATWSRGYVCKILTNRMAMGVYDPCKRDGTPDGDPILNYYPAVVTEAEWHDARTASAARRTPGKRAPNRSTNNLFAGLITDARSGGGFSAVQRSIAKQKWKQWVLVNVESAQGRTPCVSFPLEVFERAVLGKLRELDPRELMATTAPSESAALGGELARLEDDIAKLETELEAGGDAIPVLARVLAKKESRRKEVAEKLAAARAKDASPISAALGEFGTLVDVMDRAPDREDMRRRLRASLRRIVTGVWLLAMARGRTRLAAVRVQLHGCHHHRDYIIVHSPAKSNGVKTTPAVTGVCSFAELIEGDYDLRNRAHGEALEKILSALDLNTLMMPTQTADKNTTTTKRMRGTK